MSLMGYSDDEKYTTYSSSQKEQSLNKDTTNQTVLGHVKLRKVKPTWMGCASLTVLQTTSSKHPSNNDNFNPLF